MPRIHTILGLFLLLMILFSSCNYNATLIKKTSVRDNIFECNTRPKIKIKVISPIKYQGEFEYDELQDGRGTATFNTYKGYLFRDLEYGLYERGVFIYEQTVEEHHHWKSKSRNKNFMRAGHEWHPFFYYAPLKNIPHLPIKKVLSNEGADLSRVYIYNCEGMIADDRKLFIIMYFECIPEQSEMHRWEMGDPKHLNRLQKNWVRNFMMRKDYAYSVLE